ncbi:hypothetical protein COU60_03430 [Candidatus Pacearchaeota archaeon CG10_big_fil_rev_8_21_14_0_10_34_76]|nr:MAG: hypothetical protein COU60_03430 [Candidatus Pacearchaeota archaeon CG10_big_fil_rev_8_21_14_0_10_34_76]
MNHVIPSIFAESKEEFDEKFSNLVKISKKIQIDFMDGKFVSAKGIRASNVPNLKKYKNDFEAHLMVYRPEKWISKMKKKGFKKIIFHYGAIKDSKKIFKLIMRIKKNNMGAWVAFNPNVKIREILESVDKIKKFGASVDGIMFMGVYPGKEGQRLNPLVVENVIAFKRLYPEVIVQVDGGVNDNSVRKLVKAGVDIVNSGSFISNSEDPKKALKVLEKEFRSKNH